MSKKFTLEDVVTKCHKIHNKKYDYSNIVYKGMEYKYDIICPFHGVFKQKLVDHIHQEQGCDKCHKEKVRKENAERIISKIIADSKGRYTGDPDEYKSLREDMNWVCEEHGSFVATPINVRDRSYHGCLSCKSKQEGFTFIKKANTRHNHFYIYDVNNYISSRDLMDITCPFHGSFPQRPSAHLQGQGCRSCGNISNSQSSVLSQEEFFSRCKTVHGDIYNYDKTIYINAHEEIIVTCKIHGDFPKSARNHLMSSGGCNKCSDEKRALKKGVAFIENSKIKYGEGVLDYSKVKYINNKTNVELKCNLHNEWFNISPNSHMCKSSTGGCPVCGKLSQNRWSISSVRKIPNIKGQQGFFYLGSISSLDNLVKIGVAKNLNNRLYGYNSDLKRYKQHNFSYNKSYELGYLNSFVLESIMLEVLKGLRVQPNISFGGKGEMFKITQPLIHKIYEFIENNRDLILLWGETILKKKSKEHKDAEEIVKSYLFGENKSVL